MASISEVEVAAAVAAELEAVAGSSLVSNLNAVNEFGKRRLNSYFKKFGDQHRNKVMHAFYLTGTALGFAVTKSATIIAPHVLLVFAAAWNFYDGLCAFRDSLEAAEKAKNAKKLAVAKKHKTRIIFNMASSAALIIGTIAALSSPAAPVIMSTVFAFAMVCSYFNREFDKEKHVKENNTASATGCFHSILPASDGEAKNKKLVVNLSDKKSWALCIIGMTSVAVTTGLGSMGTIPLIFAYFHLKINKIVFSYLNSYISLF